MMLIIITCENNNMQIRTTWNSQQQVQITFPKENIEFYLHHYKIYGRNQTFTQINKFIIRYVMIQNAQPQS